MQHKYSKCIAYVRDTWVMLGAMITYLSPGLNVGPQMLKAIY